MPGQTRTFGRALLVTVLLVSGFVASFGKPAGAQQEVPPPQAFVVVDAGTGAVLSSRDLHKALLEDSRTAYELDRGRIPTTATLLQLVIHDPWFAWLRPLSETVVRIDVMLLPEAEATEADGVTLLEQVERLLSPAEGVEPFAERYSEALQRQPAVIMAHGDVRRVLKQVK